MSEGESFLGYYKNQMNRVASFREMSKQYIQRDISYLKIAEAGFSYTGQGSLVRCEHCDNGIFLELFQHNGELLDPKNSMFHKDFCIFSHGNSETTPNTSKENVTDTNGSSGDNITNTCYNGDFRNQHENNVSISQSQQNNHVYDDSEDVNPEIESTNSQSSNTRIICEKNPGHFGYFLIRNLRMEHLPGPARFPKVVKLLQLMSLLTVRIIVECTDTIKIGTGFVSMDACVNENDTSEEADSNGNRSQEECETIYIATSKHVLSSDNDISKVKVEFCYDEQVKGQLKSLGVASVQTNLSTCDFRSLLVCRVSEQEFVRNIMELRRQVVEVVVTIPDSVKEFLSKKVFILHHPHGGNKVMSHGDFVIAKKRLVQDGDGGWIKLQTLSASEYATEATADVYKMLMFAADTCQGSAGAPIITFKRKTPDENYYLDIWIHNGYSKEHGLGTSDMKVCNKDDFDPTRISTTPSAANEAEQMSNSNGEQHTLNSLPTVPVVLPSYPTFITKQKRLESFQDWRHQNIHEPDFLANVGFFYAGYSDCVRCFQCGLGLRSWKPGDSVLEEHKKYRSSCPFLQTVLARRENHCQLMVP